MIGAHNESASVLSDDPMNYAARSDNAHHSRLDNHAQRRSSDRMTSDHEENSCSSSPKPIPKLQQQRDQQQRQPPLDATTMDHVHTANDDVVVADFSITAPCEQQLQQFDNQGYLCLRQVLPAVILDPWKQHAIAIWQQTMQQLLDRQQREQRRRQSQNKSHVATQKEQEESAGNDVQIEVNDTSNMSPRYALSGVGVKHGYREIVMRSPGRYERALLLDIHQHASYIRQTVKDTSNHVLIESNNNRNNQYHDPNRNHWENAAMDASDSTVVLRLLQPILQCLDFVPSLLHADSWDQVAIINVSLVVSTPQAPQQAWHADGGHIDLHQHLPCHCLNVFVPLVDVVSLQHGPTELRPASHYLTRQLVPMILAAKARRMLQPPVAPVLYYGDVLIFDYRLLHRGKANGTLHENRTILVITVAQKWFKDILNFPTNSLQDDDALDGNGKIDVKFQQR